MHLCASPSFIGISDQVRAFSKALGLLSFDSKLVFLKCHPNPVDLGLKSSKKLFFFLIFFGLCLVLTIVSVFVFSF